MAVPEVCNNAKHLNQMCQLSYCCSHHQITGSMKVFKGQCMETGLVTSKALSGRAKMITPSEEALFTGTREGCLRDSEGKWFL